MPTWGSKHSRFGFRGMRGCASSRWGHQPPLGPTLPWWGPLCIPGSGPLSSSPGTFGTPGKCLWCSGLGSMVPAVTGLGSRERGLGAQGIAPLCTDGERFPAWSYVGGTVSPGLTQWWGCGLGDLVPPQSLSLPAPASYICLALVPSGWGRRSPLKSAGGATLMGGGRLKRCVLF